MTDPAPLREAAISRLAQYKLRKNIAAVLDAAWREGLDQKQLNEVAHIDTILAALPTDAVQPVGGVDREAIARVIDPALFELIDALENAEGEPEHLRLAASALRDKRSKEAYAKADAALALYATAPTAGSGWVMVPREPTEAMVKAGEKAAWDDDNAMPAIRAMPKAYRAMITAAPTVGSE